MKQLRRCPSSIFSLHSMYSTSIDWCMQIFVFSPSLPSFPQLQWDTHIHTHSYVCLSEKTEPLLSMDDDRTKAKRPAADRYFRRWFGSFILGGKVRFVVPSSFLFSILPKKSFLVRVFVCLSPPFFRPFYLALCGFGHFFFDVAIVVITKDLFSRYTISNLSVFSFLQECMEIDFIGSIDFPPPLSRLRSLSDFSGKLQRQTSSR